MKRSGMIALALGLCLVSVSGWVSRAEAAVFRSGDNVLIPSTRVTNDDIYAAGGTLVIEGNVNGDIVVTGGQVTVNGDVRGDIMAAGGTVNLNGSAEGARVAGGNVSIDGSVDDDLVVFGGNVIMSQKSRAGRDLVSGGGNVQIAGEIGRNVKVTGGTINISGTVDGDVRMEGDTLTVGPTARIDGDLNYKSVNKASIDKGAVIGGEVRQIIPERRMQAPSPATIMLLLIARTVWSYLALAVLGLLIAWLSPGAMSQSGARLAKSPWKSLGLGFLLLVNVPVVILIMMATVIGIPLALISAALYWIAIYLSNVFIGFFLGDRIIRVFKQEHKAWPGYAVLLGLLALALVRLVPVVGFLVTLVVVLFGLGAMALAANDRRKRPKEASSV